MSTLSFNLENIENYDPDAAPDGDEPARCPACGAEMVAVGDHLECWNELCNDCNYYQVIDGQLTKVAPAF